MEEACVGANIWEIYVFAFQLYHEPITTIKKNKVLKNEKWAKDMRRHFTKELT